MAKKLSFFIFFAALLPAYSLSQTLIDVYTSNRFIALLIFPFFIFFKPAKNFILDYPTALLWIIIFFMGGYAVLAIIENRNFLIYFGYVLAFLYITLLFNLIKINNIFFIKFMKIFFVLNLVYTFIQILLLNIGLGGLAMLHSNLPAQSDYSIPLFIVEPFYRYTGLFNESSPFAFYLAICHAFFVVFNENKYKKMALILLLFSGSKAGYLYLLIFYYVFSKSQSIKYLLRSVLLLFLIIFIYFFDDLSGFSPGEFASLIQRQEVLFNSEVQISLWGVDLGSTSEGELGLDFISIFLSGFGMVGLTGAFFLFVLFYRSVENHKRHLFIPPLFIGLLSSGSLLIFQYSLLFASLYCCHLQGQGKGRFQYEI